MKDKIIQIEADGNFPFSFYIEKAIVGGTEEEMTIKGVASTVNIDHDNERMSESSLKAMADIINEKSVPLRVEHQKDNNAVVGNVNKAWVDKRNQLWIEASLDKSHPGASMLYKALKAGAKLGLSVGGTVKHAVREFSEATGKMVKTFYDVILNEVSVTSRPANYDSWLVSKSIISRESDGENFVESPFYKEFLFENQCLDYMQSFAKSIPNESWKKVDISKTNENKTMNEEEKKKAQEAEETEEAKKKKAAEEGGKKEEETETTKKESEFKSFMIKSMEALTGLVSKLAKGSASDEKEETTIMEDKKKAEATETEEEKKKAESSETEEEKKKKAKAAEEGGKKDETETESAKNSDYNLKAMKSIAEKLDKLSKAMDATETEEDKEKKKKAAEEGGKKDESETTEKSGDKFVATIEKSVNDLMEKFEKGGKRFPGLTEMIVNAIRNDAEVQKEIKGMMGEAGFKKSMSFGGFPVMRTKDGKSYRLTANLASEEVEKSRKDNANKSFKELYNSEFSSSAHAGE